ncbi:hypothetical protein V6N11_064462 [Hibiscus sabdariffa]|uniref:Uncharacterized protein n=2 Tax=Hibiscus sabdariffa TaxID=183260 RepID=A0ABR2P9I6_9ROSI
MASHSAQTSAATATSATLQQFATADVERRYKQSYKGQLYFPCLIIALCTQERVPHLPSDVLTPQRVGWTGKEYHRRMRVHDAQPQSFATFDNEGMRIEKHVVKDQSSPPPTSQQLNRMEARQIAFMAYTKDFNQAILQLLEEKFHGTSAQFPPFNVDHNTQAIDEQHLAASHSA